MPEDKLSEMKEATKKFVEDLKKYNVQVKSWNVGLGKEGDAANIKISIEVAISKKK